MRPLLSVLAATTMVAGVAAAPAFAASGNAAQVGAFSAAFREDGFKRDFTGCVPDGKGELDCLPAGASMVALPDGRILYWNALEGTENIPLTAIPQGADKTRVDQSRVLSLNPTNPKASTWATPINSSGVVNKTPHPLTDLPDYDPNDHVATLFCTDQKLLPDGRVLVVGGTDYYNDPAVGPTGIGALELEGVRATRIFDPTNNSWHEAAPMHHGRWYPSMVTLADGNIFVASGVTKLLKPIYRHAPLESGTNVKVSETYNVATNTWTVNPGGDKSLPLYPRLHLLPNGKVFYDAAGQAFNPLGQSYDEVLWNMAAVYDPNGKPGASRWTNLGIPGIGGTAPGFRGSTFSAPLRMDPPYNTMRFLTGGGVLGTSPGTYVAIQDTRISEVKIGANGKETFKTFKAVAMNNRRWFSTAVPLPDGSVLAFSGGDLDEVLAPGTEQPIREAELFRPHADGHGGSWTRMATADRGRTYHNNAVLLPDGRVLVGGHAPIPNGYQFVRTNPKIPLLREFGNNNRDASFEIFTPPYALRSDRPSIVSVPSVLERGTSVTLEVDDSRGIDDVVLMRNNAQTHLVDGDARTIGLAITGRDATHVTVSIPANAAVLPPGPYRIFANRTATDSTIVPSVGKQVFIGSAAVPAYVADPAGNVSFASLGGAQVLPTDVPVQAPVPAPVRAAVEQPRVALRPTETRGEGWLPIVLASVTVGVGVATTVLTRLRRTRRFA